VVPENSEDRSIRAVVRPACLAVWAILARVVDLGGHPVSRFGHADELVTENSLKAHVTSSELEVGVTDPHGQDAEPDLADEWLRLGKVSMEPDFRAVAKDTTHGTHDLLEIFIREDFPESGTLEILASGDWLWACGSCRLLVLRLLVSTASAFGLFSRWISERRERDDLAQPSHAIIASLWESSRIDLIGLVPEGKAGSVLVMTRRPESHPVPLDRQGRA
jgi:hypothetical protein